MSKTKCEVIAYWLMGKDLCNQVKDDYYNFDNIIKAMKTIEDNPKYANVGQFSHPNENGILQLDAAYMEGNGRLGSIIETSHIKNPVEVAYSLSKNEKNFVLACAGADKYAKENGYEVSEELKIELKKTDNSHDTFGVIQVLDGKFKLAITTSGASGKKDSRVGDSPLPGSGFYCEDHIGACLATGDGEACMRSVMAKEVVDRLMLGESIEGVCQRVLERGLNKLDYKTELSLLAVDDKGNYDVYSTFEIFPFSFINKGKVFNRYLYLGQEKKQDDTFEKMYHGD